jgi:hypothetical protein
MTGHYSVGTRAFGSSNQDAASFSNSRWVKVRRFGEN